MNWARVAVIIGVIGWRGDALLGESTYPGPTVVRGGGVRRG